MIDELLNKRLEEQRRYFEIQKRVFQMMFDSVKKQFEEDHKKIEPPTHEEYAEGLDQQPK